MLSSPTPGLPATFVGTQHVLCEVVPLPTLLAFGSGAFHVGLLLLLLVHGVVAGLVVALVVHVADLAHLLAQEVELPVLLVVELLLVLLVVELLVVLLNVVEVLVVLHKALLQVLFQLSTCPTLIRQLFPRRLPTLQNKHHAQTS